MKTIFDSSKAIPGYLDSQEPPYGDFEYLEKSDRPSVRQIREMLETWFQHYPSKHQDELSARFRSDNGIESPFFELLLHELYFSAGATVEVHPEVLGETQARPDFRITLPDRRCFYLEAVVCDYLTKEERGRKRLERGIYARINNKFSSPDYYWAVTILSSSPQAPSAKKIVNELVVYQNSLNLESLTQQADHSDYLRTVVCEVEDAGWKIRFSPIPKRRSSASGALHKPLGVFLEPSATIWKDAESIRRSIESKLDQHKSLDLPYIIAVNALSPMADHEDFLDAIYGKVVYRFSRSADGEATQGEFVRLDDGVWRFVDASKRQRLTAIIGCRGISPWNVGRKTVTLFDRIHDPVGLTLSLPEFAYACVSNGEVQLSVGVPLGPRLALSDEELD